MLIKELKVEGFRNLQTLEMVLDPKMNVFVGLNGSGKTSLLESICFLALGRSFRCSNLDKVINFNSQHTSVFAVYSNLLMQQIKVGASKYKNKEKISKIGGSVSSLAEVAHLAPTQIIHETSSKIIFGEPEWRRKFLDWMVFYANQNYQLLWKDFNKILHQRNYLLKHPYSKKEYILKEIDQVFITLSEQIQQIRQNTWHNFKNIWDNCYEELNLLEEIKPMVKLFDGWVGDLSENLARSYEVDLQQGYTTCGPHRADLRFTVREKPAKEVLSRGQGKTLSISLILARAEFFQSLQRETVNNAISVLLIDDLCSELDEVNSSKIVDFLLAKHRKIQIFITGLEKDALLKMLPLDSCCWHAVDSGMVLRDTVPRGTAG